MGGKEWEMKRGKTSSFITAKGLPTGGERKRS